MDKQYKHNLYTETKSFYNAIYLHSKIIDSHYVNNLDFNSIAENISAGFLNEKFLVGNNTTVEFTSKFSQYNFSIEQYKYKILVRNNIYIRYESPQHPNDTEHIHYHDKYGNDIKSLRKEYQRPAYEEVIQTAVKIDWETNTN